MTCSNQPAWLLRLQHRLRQRGMQQRHRSPHGTQAGYSSSLGPYTCKRTHLLQSRRESTEVDGVAWLRQWEFRLLQINARVTPSTHGSHTFSSVAPPTPPRHHHQRRQKQQCYSGEPSWATYTQKSTDGKGRGEWARETIPIAVARWKTDWSGMVPNGTGG